ncbi:hypothetical protein LXA43DRAFT_1102792 [Ganoderma leucocontextum]|nr:hypothetical protein LXA43DRAFT_1102792 [Ganoderma leucocontextum]
MSYMPFTIRERGALLQRTFLGHNPLKTMHSPYVSPASMCVLTAFYGDVLASSVADLTIAQLDDDDHREFLRTMVSAPATPVPVASRTNTSTSLVPRCRTNTLLDTLIAYAVTSGSLTDVFNILGFVFALATSQNLYYVTMNMVVTKVYTNSVMAAYALLLFPVSEILQSPY